MKKIVNYLLIFCFSSVYLLSFNACNNTNAPENINLGGANSILQYDKNGYLIGKTLISYENNGKRIISHTTNYQSYYPKYQKIIEEFHSTGSNTLTEYYIKNTDTDTWKGVMKNEIIDNPKSVVITYSWQEKTENWIENQKQIYSYNANNTEVLVDVQNWDIEKKQWDTSSQKPYQKIIQTHTETGKPIQNETYNFSTDTNDWEFFQKITHAYDSNENLSSLEYEISFQFEGDIPAMYIKNRYVYLYNSKNEIAKIDFYNWIEETGKFELESYSVYCY